RPQAAGGSGVGMHFVRAGRGTPPLVFVHGFACSLEDWKPQLEHFRKTNEVLACDLRAHGATPGRAHECSIEHYGGDVAALVNNLELSRVVLVGHSMGCRVVLEANRLIADKVAGIVLVDGSRNATRDAEGAEHGEPADRRVPRSRIARQGCPPESSSAAPRPAPSRRGARAAPRRRAARVCAPRDAASSMPRACARARA